MKVAVIRYNAGNIGSVTNSLRRMSVEPVVTADPEVLSTADRVIFPGVGEASSAMASLQESGLDKLIPDLAQPVLGICLGMQLLCDFSEEQQTKCLGIIPAMVRRFESTELKIPHIGWNTISGFEDGLFEGIQDFSYVYFVHGYYVERCDSTSAVCEYGVEFSAALMNGNFFATQFHPEKSGEVGARILGNFLRNGGAV